MLESTRRGRHNRARQDRDGDHRPHEPDAAARGRPASIGAEALRLVGALEAASEHPIARAIAAAAEAELGPLPAVEGFANREGLGAEGTVDGPRARGRPPESAGRGRVWPARPSSMPPAEAAEAEGRTAIVAGWDGAVRAVFVIADTPKPSSAGAIEAPARAGAVAGPADRRQPHNSRGRRRRGGDRRGHRRGAAGRQGRRRKAAAGCRAGWWRWWATASTTRRPWLRPISAWRSARAPTWRSKPLT